MRFLKCWKKARNELGFELMSQAKKVRTNSEFDSSLKFTNDESVVKFLLEKISQIDVAMIINDGELTKYTISESFEGEIDLKEIEQIAKLIGRRYRIAGFHKIRGGLKMTINVFKDSYIIVTSRDGNSIIAIVTKMVDLERIRQIISQIKLMPLISDRLPQEDSNEVASIICENCQVGFPTEYDKCPKCGLSTFIRI